MDPYDITKNLIKKEPTDIWGLSFFPSLEPECPNDQDMPYSGWPDCPEISDCNLVTVGEAVALLGDKLKAAMEIGIDRNDVRSMNRIVLQYRPKGSFWLGVDIDDKSHLDNPEENVWTLRCNSHDQETVREFLRSKGIEKLDLLTIDGWHSVNTTINDWRYADLLSEHGIVLVHDTNFHPGDIALVEAVDRNLFEVHRCCVGHDSGITVFIRKPAQNLP